MSEFPWPADLHPGVCPVHIVNTVAVAAPPAQAWPWLVRAALWPTWYPHVRDMVVEGGGLDLGPGVRFSWSLLGVVRLHTVVHLWQPHAWIGWRGTGTGGAEGCQIWRLSAHAGGCLVHTEEVQRGAAPRLLAPVIRRVAQASHRRWLHGLAALATLAPRS
jgi:hypothetical protein